MGWKIMILDMILHILNLFRFLTPIRKQKITFISITSDHLEQDFKAIDAMLKERGDFDIHYNLIVFKKTLKDDFMYLLNCMKQLYEINTSKLIILNDNNYVVTKFKRKGTHVLQTWHACGAIKKFGNQIERQYPIKNYDIVLANSDVWKPVYASAFHVQEDQVITTGMPRVDCLCQKEKIEAWKKRFYEKYPNCEGKYIVLYAPTFRGNVVDGLRYDHVDMDYILSNVADDYVMLYKMHPLLQDVSLGESNRLINVSHESLYMLLSTCDCLISDYSSIFFDFALLQKKAICYASDFEEYDKTIGFNIQYLHDMPASICTNEQELLTQLQSKTFDFKRLQHFQKKYMPYTDGLNTERVIKEIMNFMK